jgi:hypothetical protein
LNNNNKIPTNVGSQVRQADITTKLVQRKQGAENSFNP